MSSPFPEQQFNCFSREDSLALFNSGQKNTVSVGATTLTAQQTGSTVLFNAAAGFTVTLPAPVIGLRFRFLVTVTNTSVNHKIITDAGTTFLKGEPMHYVDATTPSATAGPKGFNYDGSTHIACLMNGTTTGGLFGTDIQVYCYSATQWLISGNIICSGTIATSASTS